MDEAKGQDDQTGSEASLADERKLLTDIRWELQQQRKYNSDIRWELQQQRKYHSDVRWELQQQRRYLEIVSSALAQPTLNRMNAFMAEKQLSFRETLEKIADEKLSFARFGDGEFKLMLRSGYSLKFQENSQALRSALKNTLIANDDASRLLIGLPHPYTDLHWTAVWLDLWAQLEEMIPSDGTYGNSHVSRPIFFQKMGDEGVDLWRNVWAGEHVCVITGNGSRFSKLPRLFDNVETWDEIHSSPTHAFSRLDAVMRAVEDNSRATLFLVALGPAGTILAHQIAKIGRRAIDVGHISDSYENVFEGGAWPEAKGVTKEN